MRTIKQSGKVTLMELFKTKITGKAFTEPRFEWFLGIGWILLHFNENYESAKQN